MTKTYLFGEPTTDRKKAFPELKSLDITVIQDPLGFGDTKVDRYNDTNFPHTVRCSNSKCKQGGLELQNIVSFYENGEHEFPCNGHEGTPAGRKIGPPCHIMFKVKLVIERHPQQQS